MKIKSKLSLYFTLISSGILLIVLISVYFIFSSFSKGAFFTKLKERANVAAQLYLEADEITADSLTKVRETYLGRLPEEIIQLYNSGNNAAFIKDKSQFWTSSIIDKVRKSGYVQYTNGIHQVVGIYYKDNQGDFVILVSAVDKDSIARRNLMIKIMAILFLIVSVGLFLAGRWFAQKTLYPINDVVRQMQQIRATNLHLRVNEGKGKDEISELAQNFNRLLEHLQNAFELQRSFVTSASHELRTPVTSIIGEIEVALHKERDVEEYKQLLQSILAYSEILNDTITNLMELAQVDIELIESSLSPVYVDEVIWEIQEYWNNKLSAGSLNVQVKHLPADHGMLTLRANKSLLTIALNNIISNAFKFSNNQSVQCVLYADEKLISISINDKGIGIAKEALTKIFSSLFRAENATEFSGYGIGLYITQKILHLFNGMLSVSSLLNAGTSFTVTFTKS